MTAPPAPLDAEARARCAVTASLLQGGRVVGALALACLLAVVLAAGPLGARAGAAGSQGSVGAVAVWLALPLLLVERYFALRVALDARLFDHLARGHVADLATLDRALQQVLQVPAAKAGRTIDARIAGARRLLRAQALAGLVLLAAALGSWAWRP